jgi:hypothetical protein
VTAPRAGRDDATLRGAIVLVVAIVIGLALLARSGGGGSDEAATTTEASTASTAFDGSTTTSSATVGTAVYRGFRFPPLLRRLSAALRFRFAVPRLLSPAAPSDPQRVFRDRA